LILADERKRRGYQKAIGAGGDGAWFDGSSSTVPARRDDGAKALRR
jgi:hypothetical protein